ncbi:Translation initiation factor eIF-2B subunit alpha [Hondaea fermentalgiana]|uniref:Translation initiation factor eIF2B subunit alpha n=1 Tax=Hondaea fermentalgiana TaxID=2315210 RepID=A0A2R5GBB7_9STRA|nr:Translation initiation factor eIF-2B subunit alpha [Hondaea fermentalgiana]|eukprot:GBG28296.1 Translation initiation factor eIF-2B subunit alpha [Hondaea fermentalgiana]
MTDVVAAFEQTRGEDAEESDAVAAIRTLVGVLRATQTSTIVGLSDELRGAAEALRESLRETSGMRVFVPVNAACEVFINYVTRIATDFPVGVAFDQVKTVLVQRGEIFAERLVKSRDRLASFGWKFVQDGSVIMVHGFSRAVLEVLRRAAAQGRNFDVIVTAAGGDGSKVADRLAHFGVPTLLVADAAIGYFMERVDTVILGAEGLTENGGLINHVGTLPLAIVARAHNKPVYVAAESFKFSRLFPLTQKELSEAGGGRVDKRDAEETPSPAPKLEPLGSVTSDYTAPEYITLMFTDLGVLTPSAVSDELIKLYQ